MDKRITVDMNQLFSVLSGLSGGYGGDPDGINGNVNPKGPAGPVMMRYSKLITRQFITAVLANEQVVAVRDGEFGGRSAFGTIAEFVDDWCGTGWPRKFPPLPKPWWWDLVIPVPVPEPGPGEPYPIDLITVGIEFYDAAQGLAGTELQQVFLDSAERLIETGLNLG